MIDKIKQIGRYIGIGRDSEPDILAKQLSLYFSFHPEEAAEELNFNSLKEYARRKDISDETKNRLGEILTGAGYFRGSLMSLQRYDGAERLGEIH